MTKTTITLTATGLLLCWPGTSHCWSDLDEAFLNERRTIALTFYSCIERKQKSPEMCLEKANDQLLQLCFNQHKIEEFRCAHNLQKVLNNALSRLFQKIQAKREYKRCFNKHLKHKIQISNYNRIFSAALSTLIEKAKK